jgi:predicted hotdog family 3-hydroxylacyl-ACP dehydratase
VADGSAPAVAAIEAAAQAAAVWEATRRRRDGGDSAPRLGYLVGMRAVTFFRSRIPAEETFFATVRLEASASALTHYSMQVDLASGVLLSGTLATFLTDETMPA